MAEAATTAGTGEPAIQARPVLPRPGLGYTERKWAAAIIGATGRTALSLVAREEGVKEQGSLFACSLRFPDQDRLNRPVLDADKRLDGPHYLEFLRMVSRSPPTGAGGAWDAP